MNPDELIGYFNEHVFYELDMLRGTHDRFQACKDRTTKNALLESCGMHARNLSEFLLNEGDNRNVLASKYNPSFRRRKPAGLTGAFERLNYGMHHLGTRRLGKPKFTLDDATKILGWIEKEFQSFLDELPEPYKSDIGRKSESVPLINAAAVVADATSTTATNTVTTGTVLFGPTKDS